MSVNKVQGPRKKGKRNKITTRDDEEEEEG
jgi:hypothetical protein